MALAWTTALCALSCASACTGSGARPDETAPPAPTAPAAAALSPEATWGIKAVSLRPTLGGTMLDFRYKVVDADRALPLFDRKLKPYLFDPSTGAALGTPDDAKLGALRASARNPPVTGKQYYALFANGQGTVKRGSKVTIVLGDCKLEDVVVD
jgi:hypothetical protein